VIIWWFSDGEGEEMPLASEVASLYILPKGKTDQGQQCSHAPSFANLQTPIVIAPRLHGIPGRVSIASLTKVFEVPERGPRSAGRQQKASKLQRRHTRFGTNDITVHLCRAPLEHRGTFQRHSVMAPWPT
jgi:hypothetical protein